jgi:hypothetical protein
VCTAELLLAASLQKCLSTAEAATTAAGTAAAGNTAATAAYTGSSSRGSAVTGNVSGDTVFDTEGEQQGGAWVGDSFAFAADDTDEDHFAISSSSISDTAATNTISSAAAGLSKSRRNSVSSKGTEPLQGVRASISGVEVGVNRYCQLYSSVHSHVVLLLCE